MDNKNKNRCSKCSSTLIYVRIKTNTRICRHCGFEEVLSKEEVS